MEKAQKHNSDEWKRHANTILLTIVLGFLSYQVAKENVMSKKLDSIIIAATLNSERISVQMLNDEFQNKSDDILVALSDFNVLLLGIKEKVKQDAKDIEQAD